MKTIIKIVVALVMLTAAVKAGMAAFTSYQFEDAVHQALLFAPATTDEEIVDMVMTLASTHGIPLDADGIVVRQVGPELHVDMTYETEVPLVPGIYSRKWTFNPSVSTRMMPGGRRSPTR